MWLCFIHFYCCIVFNFMNIPKVIFQYSFSGHLCYLAANSLTFCLSKYIIISPSFLKTIYTWYMILGWQFHCLPVPFAYVAKSGLSLIAVGELSFPLDAFKIHVSLVFSSYTDVSRDGFLFIYSTWDLLVFLDLNFGVFKN